METLKCTFLLSQVLLFDRSFGPVVQLSVVEKYGIILFRSDRIFVFRLSDLQEFTEADEPPIGNGLNVPTWEPK